MSKLLLFSLAIIAFTYAVNGFQIDSSLLCEDSELTESTADETTDPTPDANESSRDIEYDFSFPTVDIDENDDEEEEEAKKQSSPSRRPRLEDLASVQVPEEQVSVARHQERTPPPPSYRERLAGKLSSTGHLLSGAKDRLAQTAYSARQRVSEARDRFADTAYRAGSQMYQRGRDVVAPYYEHYFPTRKPAGRLRANTLLQEPNERPRSTMDVLRSQVPRQAMRAVNAIREAPRTAFQAYKVARNVPTRVKAELQSAINRYTRMLNALIRESQAIEASERQRERQLQDSSRIYPARRRSSSSSPGRSRGRSGTMGKYGEANPMTEKPTPAKTTLPPPRQQKSRFFREEEEGRE